MESKEFYTTKELAELLGISRIAVFNRIKKGDIKAQKMGRNFVMFKKDVGDLEVFSSSLFKLAKDWAISNKEFSVSSKLSNPESASKAISISLVSFCKFSNSICI
jgi:excisionase family DNA binding protein